MMSNHYYFTLTHKYQKNEYISNMLQKTFLKMFACASRIIVAQIHLQLFEGGGEDD